MKKRLADRDTEAGKKKRYRDRQRARHNRKLEQTKTERQNDKDIGQTERVIKENKTDEDRETERQRHRTNRHSPKDAPWLTQRDGGRKKSEGNGDRRS